MKRILSCVILCLLLQGCAQTTGPQVRPPGADTTAKTDALKLGAQALQSAAPLGPMDIYLVGFHPLKDAPQEQMIAHHYCTQVNEDFAQCTLFDGNARNANLTGIEFIISERLFLTLPEAERQYWHPHNGEILSGQLVAPGIPEAAEKELMRGKMNSYGKTWHVWMTQHGHDLPVGPAMLAWSFSRDGEVREGLVEARDRALGVDTAAKREARTELAPLARPQAGVDALHGAFPGPTREIPGVVDRNASGAASSR